MTPLNWFVMISFFKFCFPRRFIHSYLWIYPSLPPPSLNFPCTGFFEDQPHPYPISETNLLLSSLYWWLRHPSILWTLLPPNMQLPVISLWPRSEQKEERGSSKLSEISFSSHWEQLSILFTHPYGIGRKLIFGCSHYSITNSCTSCRFISLG